MASLHTPGPDGRRAAVKFKPPLEVTEQRALAAVLDAWRLLWLHVPNGGLRSVVGGAVLKAMGMRKGAPDVIIFNPPPLGKYVGCAIELKRLGKGRATAEQLDCLRRLSELGWATQVCHGSGEAVRWLVALGYGPKHQIR